MYDTERMPCYADETEYVLTSLQCGRQIAQLKDECEETKKTLEKEASKLRGVSLITQQKG